MFPIEAAPLRRQILNELLPAFLRDNVRARKLKPDGSYTRVRPKRNEVPFRSQQELLTPDALIVPRSLPSRAVEHNGAETSRSKKTARSKS